MCELRRISVIMFILLAMLLLHGQRVFADSVRFDVSRTHASGLNRYCFQVVNDDKDDKPGRLSESIASFTVIFTPDQARANPNDDCYRNNIIGPSGWKGSTSGGGWDNNNKQPKSRRITWKTKDTKQTISPGDRSGTFCFVMKGYILMKKAETGHLTPKGKHSIHCEKNGYSFGSALLDEEHDDEDFMKDKDKDGIPDQFDEAPNKPDDE